MYRSTTDILYFATPSYAEMCPTEEACSGAQGYKPIVVSNPPIVARNPRLVAGIGVPQHPFPFVLRHVFLLLHSTQVYSSTLRLQHM